MPVIDGFTLPAPEAWIVSPARVADVGKLLLRVACAGLAVYGLDARYERRLFTFGKAPVLEQSTARQIAVVCTKVQLGQAGQELFQFNRHEIGRSAFQTAIYDIELAGPFPVRQHGEPATKVPDVDSFSSELCTEGFVVWNTLLAVMHGGVSLPTVEAKDMLVSPMVPKDPQGRVAAWAISVAMQL